MLNNPGINQRLIVAIKSAIKPLKKIVNKLKYNDLRKTRADDLATLKVEQSAMSRLVAAVDQIIPSQESKFA